MASETNEWLNPLLENLVQAAYGPGGHAMPTHDAAGHTRLGYTHEDLDQLLDLFIAFAQQETAADNPAEAADAVVHVGEAIVQALDEAATAERTLLSNPASSRWDEALLHWDAAAQALAGSMPRRRSIAAPPWPTPRAPWPSGSRRWARSIVSCASAWTPGPT